MSDRAKTLPETSLSPYLVVRGAREAIEFYQRVFGAVEIRRMDDGERIGHAEMRLGQSLLMLADEYPERGIVGPRAFGGSPVRLRVEARDVDAVAARAAAGGAKILQPPTDQPYGERNTKLEDPFGHVWIFSAPLGRPAVQPIPDGYHTVTPYLVVQGVPKLLDFLTHAFAARERLRSLRPDGAIQHAEVWIGDSVVQMGEAGGPWKPMVANLNLYVENCDAAYRRAIEAGARSLREPATQFYGDRSAGVEDPCGNNWWISTHVEDVSPEELERRMAASRSD